MGQAVWSVMRTGRQKTRFELDYLLFAHAVRSALAGMASSTLG